MADIVGLVASVLQLVDTIKKARDYTRAVRNAPKEQKRLLVEIQNLEPLIKELEDRIKCSQSERATDGKKKFEEPLIQLKGTMERLAKNLDHSGSWNRNITSRLTWALWGKEDVQEALDVIERFKSSLDIWLGLDICSAWRITISEMNAWKLKVFVNR
ncbi:hypothetical protein K438DRAFT_1765435 [Mycena galopus ATCC 62051]|nr:hypothetical protein K438DRAFT_1765435 [Mycena galopus ATCC 62051]